MTKVKKICASCGSEEVVLDAWACWDEEAQCWELKSTYEYSECLVCGPCQIKEKVVEE